MADSSPSIPASGTDTALSRRAAERGVDAYTGIEKRVFDVPSATMEAVLRQQVKAHGGLKMSSARDVLTGGRVIRLSATGWKGQYRNAEIRLTQSEGSTSFCARADVREPTRKSSIQEALSSIVTVGGLSYLIYTLPWPYSAYLGAALVLCLPLMAFARRDAERGRRGFLEQMERLLDRIYVRLRAVEHAPGQLSLTGGQSKGRPCYRQEEAASQAAPTSLTSVRSSRMRTAV